MGSTAEELKPLAYVQSLQNRSGVLACSHCGAFVGSARAQVAAMTQPRCMKDLESAISKGRLPILRQSCTPDLPTPTSGAVMGRRSIAKRPAGRWPGGQPMCRLCPEDIHGAEFCRNGCGEIFCSSACEVSSFGKGHALTCVGQLATTDHPLYELKVAAIKSGYYEIVTLAVKLVTMALAEEGAGPVSHFLRSSATLAAQQPWDEGAADSNSDSDDKDEGESFTSATWALCNLAFDMSRHAELAGDAGASIWPKLLGYVACRAVEVDRPSPVLQYCQDVPKAGLTSSEQKSLQAAILSWTEGIIVDTSEDEGSRPAKRSRCGLDKEQSFYRLLDESDSRLPRLHGLAILPQLDSLSMSCVPNCAVTIVKGSFGSVGFSLSCSPEDGPRSLCPFSTVLSKSERSAMWRRRGDRQECACARCLFEGGGAASDAVGLKDLRRIAQLAQDDHRFADALRAYDAILALQPRDGDALFGRARVTSWDDRWSEAYRLMLAASQLAPTHDGIRMHLSDEQIFIPAVGDVPSTSLQSVGLFTRVPIGHADVYVSAESHPLLSPDECAQAIVFAEEHVAGTGGWKSQRHVSVPTTDVQVHTIPKLRTWFSCILQTRIYPALASQYGICPANMRVIDAFVVKYDARAQHYLPVHQDQSQYSLTLPLNSNDEYAGGGTYFVDLNRVLNCSAGGMISFPGRLLHGGHPIYRGKRYILVALLYEYKDGDLAV